MATSERKLVWKLHVARLVAPQPPADIAAVPLATEAAPVRTWYRITDRKYPSCLFWSRSGVYRFDSSAAKWGVCYAAEAVASAVQEIWGDRARHKAPIDWTEFEKRDVWRIDLPSGVSLLKLAGPNLTAIRATLQCFTGSNKTSQNWGAALMNHPASLDGLLYLGRRCGAPCVALFGDQNAPRRVQAGIRVNRLGPLVNWDGFFPLRSQLRIRISNLPPVRPPILFCA